MQENKCPKYLGIHEWAKLISYIWLRPHLASQFEEDPVQAIVNAKAENPESKRIVLDYQFTFSDPHGPRTKLVRVPENPGYLNDDLNDAILGLKPIVPMDTWLIHGISGSDD